MERVHAKHFGVYGVIVHEEALLVIKKNRGPYTGQYDLPGGSLEFGEEIEQGLAREVEEEVGGSIKEMKHLTNQTNLADWDHNGILTTTYHIGMYYLVSLMDNNALKTDPDGHDSDGALWVPLTEITSDNMAPIAYKALKKSFFSHL